MQTVGLVFVLFAPDDDALANLEHARSECARTVVVDNTIEPDLALHERLRRDGLIVIENRNVGGLARAYNRGVDRLADLGCELFFFLDQDSELAPGYFERMTTATDDMSGAPFLVGPLIYEIRMGRYFPDLTPTNADEADCLRPTNTVISSGSVVSAAAFRQLGPFWEGLFIEYVDTEYSLRAARHKVPVLVNTAEVLRQHTGAITRHGRRFTTNHVAWRRYYLVRNVIATWRAYGPLPPTMFWGAGFTARELFVVVRYESDKFRKTLAILVGAVDGFRKRLGQFEPVHPKVSRYCNKKGAVGRV